MDAYKTAIDGLFIMLGAIMVLAMHAGFAFLELGTVRQKNQVNALVKILVDFAVSTIAYFFVGYSVAYGVSFFTDAQVLADALRAALDAQWDHAAIAAAMQRTWDDVAAETLAVCEPLIAANQRTR